jgi:hypothetical protein
LTAAEDAEDDEVVALDSIDDHVLGAGMGADRRIEFRALARDPGHRHERVEGGFERVRVAVGLLARPVAGGIEPDVLQIDPRPQGSKQGPDTCQRLVRRARRPGLPRNRL